MDDPRRKGTAKIKERPPGVLPGNYNTLVDSLEGVRPSTRSWYSQTLGCTVTICESPPARDWNEEFNRRVRPRAIYGQRVD